MKPVSIDDATALRVRIELTIDRKTGNCRWVTHGMTDVNDMVEQHLIFCALNIMLNASMKLNEQEPKSVN